MKIERLDQLTMAQFIDIACGDYRLIEWDKIKAHELLSEYQRIANPSGYEGMLIDASEKARTRSMMLLFSALHSVLLLDGEKDVKGILLSMGYRRTEKMDSERLKNFLAQKTESEKAKLQRIVNPDKQEEENEDQWKRKVREGFYSEVATLMRLFKMQIDLQSINAEVYANLRRQAEDETKAMRASMKR